MAEREGFEPSIRGYRIHTFQACAFDHSATAPHACREGAPSRAGAARQATRLPHLYAAPIHLRMERRFGTAPSAEEIEKLARAALDRLPAQFVRHLGDILLQVEEFADEELLAELDIDDPFQLSGVYEGLPLHVKSIEHSGTMPDRIRLFRRPILDEWAARGDETLERLVAHVLVHEVGHHFGLSDEAMHALEEAAG